MQSMHKKLRMHQLSNMFVMSDSFLKLAMQWSNFEVMYFLEANDWTVDLKPHERACHFATPVISNPKEIKTLFYISDV